MIGLMDCNNFFVSCERLFRPDLKRRPVAVLSSNDGCIVARSQEVKDLGIPMGAPLFQVRKECEKHGIVLFSSNFQLYRNISSRVMHALREECGHIDVYSIDEAFFEVGEELSDEKIIEIRGNIIQKTGIPVSIGIAKTKTLAKVANSIAKKGNVRRPTSNMGEGVCRMDEELWETVVRDMSCGSVWGIGRQTSAFLAKAGINTVGELLTQDTTFIKHNLGVVGERLVLELRGMPTLVPGDQREGAQESYTSSRSFGKVVTDKLTLMSALGHHVAHIAEKLRAHDVVASTLTIIVRGSRFGAFAHREGVTHVVLETATDDTFILTKEASRLLDAIYDPEIPYTKAGVIVGHITPKQFLQSTLFDEEKIHDRTHTLSALSDSLNKRFGRDTIHHGVMLGKEKWQERTELRSPQYTTRWTDVAHVTAK
jgi:DNA polymerase V